ncbi:zinc ribbon domain-containing protein [Paenibacillus solisilvae]|uniref:Zinc ribbon domain-containing protein n=1 Tax=Paenibacillus solisilvae TaxID=2486751 RepID=A0ABW0W762_9BACL
MSFLDKLKQGASEAAKKAQQTVEITKLKSQISGKEKDQEKLFLQIGAALYRSHQAGNVADSEQEVMGCCQQLDEIQADIQLIEERIKMIRFEKTCTCGKVVALDTKFCPDCGTQLPQEPRPDTTIGEIQVICSKCGMENELNTKYCYSCGTENSSSIADEFSQGQ